MPAGNADSTGGTFIHSARRAQLVGGAIEVIAESGMEDASIVRIARHCQVSRGVVAYHFSGRDDLITAVVAEIYGIAEREVKPAVVAAASPREALLAFVGHSIDFYVAFPKHMAALREISVAARRSPQHQRAARPQHVQELSDVAALLRAGQRDGQFRAFDCDRMAALLRGVLDSAAQLVTQQDQIAELRAEALATADAMTAPSTAATTRGRK